MLPNQIEEQLLERDLVMLREYANRRLLPSRRLQLQTAMVVQYLHADPTKPLSFYDVTTEPAPMPEDTADDIGSLFAAVAGGNVFKLGQGRKKKG